MSATRESDSSQFQALLSEWRASWRPGVGAIIGGSLGYSLWAAISSLFVIPLEQEFGWSRGQIAFAHYAGLVVAFVAPLVGRLVDRVGAKPVLMTGLAIVGIMYALLSQMNGALELYYFFYFLLNLFGIATTGITVTRIVAGNFRVTRGTALALVRSALGLSAALTPLLLHPAIASHGSTGGFLVLSALTCLVALPGVYFLVPSRNVAVLPNASAAPALAPTRWATLLARPKVRIICLAAMLNYAPVVALVSQLQPIGMGLGLSNSEAAAAIGVVGIATGAGALLSGLLVDRFWAPAVAFTLNALAGMGCLSLALLGDSATPAMFYLAALLVGIGQGAEIDIVAFMIARYFGLSDYSTIYGLTVTCISLATAVSASLIGSSYDAFGNYQLAIFACATSFGLAAIVYLMMGRYPQTPGEA